MSTDNSQACMLGNCLGTPQGQQKSLLDKMSFDLAVCTWHRNFRLPVSSL